VTELEARKLIDAGATPGTGFRYVGSDSSPRALGEREVTRAHSMQRRRGGYAPTRGGPVTASRLRVHGRNVIPEHRLGRAR
jgi:hypothetical protein